MKIRKRNTTTIREAETLLTKYYEGRTSVAEEKLLARFLSRKNLPKRFEAEKAMFGYFENEKPRKTAVLPNFVKWAAAAAVATAVIIGVSLRYNAPVSVDYAYVDGKKITDEQKIKSLVGMTVSNFPAADSELKEGFNNITENEIIENQLDVFSGLDF
ncbi:MAG: hypothetical protein ACK5KP_04720 [Paludibacteraceae bacterium]